MAKRTWVSVKRGLLEPKHREKLGAAVWLYMYILDRADWEQGAVLEWTDGGAAEELGMDINTLRNHRRRLEDQGYISTQKKQHHQKLYIHNWTNPREYSGKVHNPSRQSTKQSTPSPDAQSSNQSGNQSGNQSSNQSSNQPIGEITTLTYSQTSKVKHQKSIEDGGFAAPDPREQEFSPGKPEPIRVPVGQEFESPKRKKDERQVHPAAKLYRQRMHLYVNRDWVDELIAVVGDAPENLAKWDALLRAWSGHGWRPGNIAGMLDAFRAGGIRNNQKTGETAEQRFERRVRDLG